MRRWRRAVPSQAPSHPVQLSIHFYPQPLRPGTSAAVPFDTSTLSIPPSRRPLRPGIDMPVILRESSPAPGIEANSYSWAAYGHVRGAAPHRRASPKLHSRALRMQEAQSPLKYPSMLAHSVKELQSSPTQPQDNEVHHLLDEGGCLLCMVGTERAVAGSGQGLEEDKHTIRGPQQTVTIVKRGFAFKPVVLLTPVNVWEYIQYQTKLGPYPSRYALDI